MFDIGFQELVLILVIALLVFGPKNLPQLGRSMGRAMREFRRASDEFRSTIETNLQMNDLDPPPAAAATETEPAAAPTDFRWREGLLVGSNLRWQGRGTPRRRFPPCHRQFSRRERDPLASCS